MMLKETEKNLSMDQPWLDYADALQFGNVHFHVDPKTGLRAIVALHNTQRGAAIGGCRCLPYESTQGAIKDALRLAQMMTYKSALANLPHGGAKAVLIKPDKIHDREAYFQAFGRFIHSLNGLYLTAVDSGTSMQDMDIIQTQTPYVLCTSPKTDAAQGASAYTALGVCRSIEAAVQHRLGKASLEGISVAIQGVGHVGRILLQLLHERGAKITIADTDPEHIAACASLAPFDVCEPGLIHTLPCDIFSPCALGGMLNPTTIGQINAPMVIGAANNQLKNPSDAALLAERGILYAPDFAVNAGGLLYAAGAYRHAPEHEIRQATLAIYDTVMQILATAETSELSAYDVAIGMAEDRITP